jgi:hypothetical protein
MTPVQRAASRFCLFQGWAPLAEAILPDGLRADVLALTGEGRFVIIECKSSVRDFTTDRKWPGYRAWCDLLFFAVDAAFPREILPEDVGLIVADGPDAALLRAAPGHALAPARRRSLLERFAVQAARRLAVAQDPDAAVALGAALRVE